jgi:hypothetical protein
VALSDAFQQPGLHPQHASVFTFSVKSMHYPPIVANADQLDLVVEPLIQRMLHGSPTQVPRLARRIDRRSYRVLGPKFGPSPIPRPSSG